LSFDWTLLKGPYFGNELAEFVSNGRSARAILRKSAEDTEDEQLHEVARIELSARLGQ
jgi:hypothetical protein